MSLHIPFDNTYARLPERFFTRLPPTPVAAPEFLALNQALADQLGLELPDDPKEIALVFAGNALPEGAAPLAQVYAGHQFGGWSPQLGDGRAILLGEVEDRTGQRHDIQLKGSGPTPYSRMGDGRAWLGPVMREYIVSEAMAALGIPTTRALAAVLTGEPVLRETALPGAVLTRVAASHLRVGTFQYFAARQDVEGLRTLTDYAIARHYPDADGPRGLLQAVISAQASLIAKWMGVGFIHGVMNTDNCTISGETIDYGPCAFMDAYASGKVFSSIDQFGRYAFDNQPNIAVWNLAQLASSLIALMPDQDDAIEAFTEDVNSFVPQFDAAWRSILGAKIGLGPEHAPHCQTLLKRMEEGQADFTRTFRALSGPDPTAARDEFLDPEAFDPWHADWWPHLANDLQRQSRMEAVNPALIPRNHRIEEAITAGLAGDFTPFERLMRALSTPFTLSEDDADLTHAPTTSETVTRTFCGT